MKKKEKSNEYIRKQAKDILNNAINSDTQIFCKLENGNSIIEANGGRLSLLILLASLERSILIKMNVSKGEFEFVKKITGDMKNGTM